MSSSSTLRRPPAPAGGRRGGRDSGRGHDGGTGAGRGVNSRAVAGTALAATLAAGAGLLSWAPWHSGSAKGVAGGAAAADSGEASVVQRLGAVPIPTPTASSRVAPVARPRHPQLLAMGETVEARVPDGDAMVSALGPTQDLGNGAGSQRAIAAQPPRNTAGTIAVTVAPRAGRLAIRATDFSSRDQMGAAIPLHALGAATVTAPAPAAGTAARAGAAGRAGTLRLRGRFPSGSAQLTWRHGGRVLAIWVFTVELG